MHSHIQPTQLHYYIFILQKQKKTKNIYNVITFIFYYTRNNISSNQKQQKLVDCWTLK